MFFSNVNDNCLVKSDHLLGEDKMIHVICLLVGKMLKSISMRLPILIVSH